MIRHKLQIEHLDNLKNAPYWLLLLADPSEKKVRSYLPDSECYLGLIDDQVVGVLVLKPKDLRCMEIMNIAIAKHYQGSGYGRQLLRFAENYAKEKDYSTLVLGTGNSSINQLALYQKVGFEIDSIDKDYFLKHYDMSLEENGIPCVHRINLIKQIQK